MKNYTIAKFLLFFFCLNAKAHIVVISPPGLIPDGLYSIRLYTGKSLDGSSIDKQKNGTDIVIWDYWGGDNQLWQLTHLGNNEYQIICEAGGKALSAWDGDVDKNGCRITLWDYWGGASQKWKIESIENGKYSIRCVGSTNKKAIYIDQRSTYTNGAKAQLWDYRSGENQKWIIEKVATGRKVSIGVGAGEDDLRKGVRFDLLLHGGGVISNIGAIGHVPKNSRRTGFFNIPEVKSSDIKGVRLTFDPSPTNPFDTPDNWDFKSFNLTFHFNDGSSCSLVSKSGSPIHRFTNDSQVFDVLLY